MKLLKKEELLEIKGGTISATYINAIVKGIDVILELGRSLGTAIRKWSTGNICAP